MPDPEASAVTIAKGVEAMIRAAQFSQRDFTLERSYADWDVDLKDLDGLVMQEAEKLRVDVVAHTLEQSAKLSSRSTMQFVVPVDIAVRKKFGPDKQDSETGRIRIEELDALMLFLQELHTVFAPVRLTDFKYAAWDEEAGGTKILAGPITGHLRESQQFTGLLRIYFRADLNISPGSELI